MIPDRVVFHYTGFVVKSASVVCVVVTIIAMTFLHEPADRTGILYQRSILVTILKILKYAHSFLDSLLKS